MKTEEKDKVKQLADKLYNQKTLDGWKNISMESCLKRAMDYYRIEEMGEKIPVRNMVKEVEQLLEWEKWKVEKGNYPEYRTKEQMIKDYITNKHPH